MDKLGKEYHCEDCRNFNENEIPADCLKGRGKVAFRHPICSDFKSRENEKVIMGEEKVS